MSDLNKFAQTLSIIGESGVSSTTSDPNRGTSMTTPEDPTPRQRYREYIILLLVMAMLTLTMFHYCGPRIRDWLFPQ